jgi:hypothetical protein
MQDMVSISKREVCETSIKDSIAKMVVVPLVRLVNKREKLSTWLEEVEA